MKQVLTGASAKPTGPSQAEPKEVSALRASVPCAFTPGPWNADFGEVYRIRSANGGVATVQHVHLTGRRAREEVVANARLIAAAPDMFEALAVIIANAGLIPDPATGESTDCYAVPIDDIEAAIAAFAKASGTEAGTAETAKTGSVHDGPTSEAGDAQ